jgi:ketosteroid isomerase-like protein
VNKLKLNMTRFITLLFISIFIFSCEQKTKEKESNFEVDMSTFEKEIESRLREYEQHLKNEDSIALGNMYMEDAEIIPSVVGRDNITKAFGKMIRGGTTGSSFKTTKLWGNEQLLVEEGTGTWYQTNGTAVGSGRYLLVWKKDDGQWKILRDTWFSDKKK